MYTSLTKMLTQQISCLYASLTQMLMTQHVSCCMPVCTDVGHSILYTLV